MAYVSNLLLVFLFWIPLQVVSQQSSKASNNWYFGNHAGITFNTSPPSSLKDGILNTQEGVATLSDFQGELLFYTDGSTIWDSTHRPMPLADGTLRGHFSSTQSAIIVPTPGNINTYYVFTLDELGGSNGLRYSIINTNLPGNGSNGSPLGDIVPSTLNTSLVSPVCEKITSIQKDNDGGYWVIVHGWRNNDFYAYEITCQGLNPNPVVTSIGSVHQGGNDNINAVGYLRSTLDGSKIALASRTTNSIDVFDFDKSTGIVRNEFQIFSSSSSLYGIEFSPSGDYLYIGGSNSIERFSFLDNSLINISYDDSSNLESNNAVRALQLGPDLNIYISHRNYEYLSVIKNPDNGNVFVEVNGIFLNTDNTGRACRFGLPNNVVFPQPKYDSIEIRTCKGVPIQFENETYEGGSSSLVNLMSNEGCDSVILLTIIEYPEFTSALNFEACENSFIEFEGTEIQAGSQQDFIFQDMNGCDSIITVIVNLDLDMTFEADVFLETCAGQSVIYNNDFYPPGTDTTITILSLDNCDSLINLTIVELPESTSSLNLQACKNTSVEFNGVEIQAGSQEDFIFQDMNGCDSIVTVFAEIASIIEEDLLLETCFGNSIIYRNEFYPPGTDLIINVESTDNCDTAIHLVVFEYPETSSSLSLEACENGSVDYNGTELFVGDQELFIFQDLNGCDSTVTVSVELAEIIVESVSLESCSGEVVLFNDEEFLVGTDTIFETFDEDGCKRIISLEVNQIPESNFSIITDDACANLNNGLVNLSGIEGGRPPFQYSIDGENFMENPLFSNLAAADYTYSILDDNNCIINTDFTIVEIPEIIAEVDSREMACEEDSILVTVFTNIHDDEIIWSWSNGATDNSTYISEPGLYNVVFENECQSFDEDINITRELLDIESLVYIPNAFTPNLDGINDYFQVFKNKNLDLQSFELQVFDRWGNLAFLAEDIDTTWDGDFRGKGLQDGVYVWWLKIEGEVCRESVSIFEKGEVTISK